MVDNPLRDLDSIVLVARHLAERGCDAYLVPMYTQGYEIADICPDAVILNYVRKVNIDLIKAYSRAGIFVGVLDTEGRVAISDEQYVGTIAHEEGVKNVGLICLWGERQRDALLKYSSFTEDVLKVTGTPRNDFFSDNWKAALKKPLETEKPVILMVTTFPLAFPLFTGDVNKEIEILMKSGFKRDYLVSRVSDEKKVREKLLELIKNLSRNVPEAQIIIRPHPFENGDEYNENFSSLPNVSVIREGVVAGWVNAADVVVHMNSSVALDCVLNGKIPITVDWVLSDSLREMAALSYNVSYKAKSDEDLANVVRSAIAKKRYVPENFIGEELMNEIESLFYRLDGNAAMRVADAIMEKLEISKNKSSKSACGKMGWYGSKNSDSVVGWVDGIGRKLLGALLYDSVRASLLRAIRGFGNREMKRIPLKTVQEVISNINSCTSDGTKFSVELFASKDSMFKKVAGESVMIRVKADAG